jgi:hypothetical protein
MASLISTHSNSLGVTSKLVQPIDKQGWTDTTPETRAGKEEAKLKYWTVGARFQITYP